MGAMFGVSLACCDSLFGRFRALFLGAARGGVAAYFATAVGGWIARLLAATGPASLLAAAIVLVDGRPGAAFGLLFGNAPLLVASAI